MFHTGATGHYRAKMCTKRMLIPTSNDSYQQLALPCLSPGRAPVSTEPAVGLPPSDIPSRPAWPRVRRRPEGAPGLE